MTREKGLTWFWVSFAIGATVAFTNLLAPVHEFGHYALGLKYNDEVEITGWSTTRVELRASQVYAGWFFEIWIFFLLGLFLCGVGRSDNTMWMGAWALGYAQLTWFRALKSTDFTTLVDKVIVHYGQEYAQVIRSMVFNGWMIRGIVLFSIMWIALFFMLKINLIK